MNVNNKFEEYFQNLYHVFIGIMVLPIILIGCSRDNQIPPNPAVQNLAYEYFLLKSELLHGKINIQQFEQGINSINLSGVPSNIQQNFMKLKPSLMKFVSLRFKSTGDILWDIGSSAVRGWFGDPTVLLDGAKQMYEGFNINEYAKTAQKLEDIFVNSLSNGGITQQWFDNMLKEVGLYKGN